MKTWLSPKKLRLKFFSTKLKGLAWSTYCYEQYSTWRQCPRSLGLLPPCVVCVERARGERAKGKKGEESGRPLKYFVELQHWTGALVTCSPRSIGTLYHMIHSINHVPKRPNPSLNKDSSTESKGCVFLSGKLNLRFIVNRHCDGHTMVQLMKIHHKHTYIKRSPSIASDPITKDDFLIFKKLILVNLSLL